MWQPGWEEGLGKNGYLYLYGWVPSCSSETATTLLISYNPIQTKKLKVWRWKKRIGLPWWSNGKESACQWRNIGSISGPGISHTRHSSWWSPCTLGPVLLNNRRLYSLQLEKACTQRWKPSMVKNTWVKKIFFKIKGKKKNRFVDM